MTKDELELHNEILLKERQRVIKSITDINNNLGQTIRDSTGDISAYATHLADLGSESNEREKEVQILDIELQNLKRIDEALKRIYKKTYGICSYCGKNISPKRLKVIPYAEFCVDCKRIQEKNRNFNNRK